MVKQKRVSRRQKLVAIDEREQKNIEVEGREFSGEYDDANTLVLPMAKRSTKFVEKPKVTVRKLSKRERKKLQRIVDQKEKKVQRAALIKSLQQVQAKPEELSQMTSTTDILSGKLVKKISMNKKLVKIGNFRVNSISGHARRWNGPDYVTGDGGNLDNDGDDDTDDDDGDDDTDDDDDGDGDDGDGDDGDGDDGDDDKNDADDGDDGDGGGHGDRRKVCSSSGKNVGIRLPLDAERLDDENGKRRKRKTSGDGSGKSGKRRSLVPEDEGNADEDSTPCRQTAAPKGKAKRIGPVGPGQRAEVPGKRAELPGKRARATKFVPLNRTAAIQAARSKLPVFGEEQVIVEKINENEAVIICGETGSGKTTQVPQFLYEAGYAHRGGIIGVTEPRRVAAVSMSQRVAEEMCLPRGVVSYQIRYEKNATPATRILFMTDGVLLREIQNDFVLSKYSVIVLDEAHERTIFTDILIGLLSRIIRLRKKRGNDLKLIIMSATLRVEDFTKNSNLFKVVPPTITVESRQFPVSIHFNKHTPGDAYLDEAYKKVCKIHNTLPDGGILVFVTGQQEVVTLIAKLRRTFTATQQTAQPKVKKRGRRSRKNNQNAPPMDGASSLQEVHLEDYPLLPIDEEAELNQLIDNQVSAAPTVGEEKDEVESFCATEKPLFVLPLYSLLPSKEQCKVFDGPPEGSRLCVVATNIAETSITIPNVKYVVDTGKAKTKFYDKVTGVSTFQVAWTSQASADQRAGRAGRTGPGHCYRLYSSAVFLEFPKFASPEITRRPVDDLVLQMKSMNIDRVTNFPFPTHPGEESLLAAEKLLTSLGALQNRRGWLQNDPSPPITQLGRVMAQMPVAPRYARMISAAEDLGVAAFGVMLVSALSVPQFLCDAADGADAADGKDGAGPSERAKKIRRTRTMWAGQGNSLLLGDAMVLLKALGACEYAGTVPSFCARHGIRVKAAVEARRLHFQLARLLMTARPGPLDGQPLLQPCPERPPPDDADAELLRRVVLTGLGDRVARMLECRSTECNKKLKHAYQSMELSEPVFIHPTSVLCQQGAPFVVYQSIDETAKLYMKGVVAIEGEWLPHLCRGHCTLSDPLRHPPPRLDALTKTVLCHFNATYGPHCWSLPPVELAHPPGRELFLLFARFLLEGLVMTDLRQFSSRLLASPAALKFQSSRLRGTDKLLERLVAANCDSHAKLLAQWERDRNFLLDEFLEWIPVAAHEKARKLWPPKR